MFRTKHLALASAAATAVALTPSAALAQPGGSQIGLSRADLQGVPARVAKRLNRVERSLQRAEDAIDDNDSALAVTRLGAADAKLKSALKAVNHRLDDSDVTGAYAAVVDDVVETTEADFDGQTGDVVTSLSTLMHDAIDGRDSIIASLTDSDVLSTIADDASTEGDDVAEAIADDQLTDEAKASLQSAADKLAATETAASGAADAADTGGDTGDDDPGDDGGDCPHGGGGHGPGGPTGPTGPSGPQQD